MVSKVFMICDAYESGFGHGLKQDGLDLSKTPHGDPELGEAYQLGYEAGMERAPAQAEPSECDWRQEDDENMPDTYRTQCGQLWSFIDGGPADNSVKFCHCCGKPVKEVAAE